MTDTLSRKEATNQNLCKCGCAQEVAAISYWGMFETHNFHKFDVETPEAAVAEWRAINARPYPAIVSGEKVDDMRPLYLCSAILKNKTGKEICRVGQMVQKDEPEKVQAWLTAVKERAPERVLSLGVLNGRLSRTECAEWQEKHAIVVRSYNKACEENEQLRDAMAGAIETLSDHIHYPDDKAKDGAAL